MDLGISGRSALVCAASKGLGRGCAEALAREGCHVFIVARGREALEATADEIRRGGGQVTSIAADLTTPEGRQEALGACPEPDILINNCGGPPPGDFREWGRDDWIRALDANMLAPIALMRATVDGMMARGFGRIVNITSTSVKAPIPLLGLSNGARSGLTGFVAGLARQTVSRGVTINNLLPGQVMTDRLRAHLAAAARHAGEPSERFVEARMRAIPAGRFGTAEEFGAICAFLCSVHAAYVTGQNVVCDGGAYPGTY
jgi:3-oxoacyl-[acyl-carrier protein] reductase